MPGLTRQLLVYGGVTGLSQGLTFVVLGLFARWLSASAYGAYGLVTTLVTLGAAVLSFGLIPAYFHFFSLHRERVGVTSLSFVLAMSIVLVVAVLPFRGWLGPVVFGDDGSSELVALVLWVVVLETCTVIPLTHLRAEQAAGMYGGIVLVKQLVVLLTSVIAVGQLDHGLGGALTALVIGSGVGLALAVRASPVLGGRPDLDLLRRMLVFGLPLQSAQLLNWALTYIDRYLLAVLVSLSAVAPYTAASSLVNGVNGGLMAAFTLLWPPVMYQIALRPDAAVVIGRIATTVVTLFLFVNVCLALLARPLLSLYAPPYVSAAGYLPLLALAYVAYCPLLFANSALQLSHRTGRVTLALLSGTAVNVVANVLLIPALGGAGAAWATLVGFATVTVVAHRLARTRYSIEYEGRELVLMSFLALGGLILHAISPALPLSLALLAGYGVLTWRILSARWRELRVLDLLAPGRPGSTP